MTKNPLLHQTLNPKIWQNQQLKPQVKTALIKIAKTYYEFLNIPVDVLDIRIVGSQANYNYSPYSDLDLHLIVDFDKVSCDQDVEDLFKTKRDLWKIQHNISIYGIPVELYTEDLDSHTITSSYSIIKDTWIKKPSTEQPEIDLKKTHDLYQTWKKIILMAIKHADTETCNKVKTLLWNYRKTALRTHGEFYPGNLAFKRLRDQGLTSKLVDVCRQRLDHDLSL